MKRPHAKSSLIGLLLSTMLFGGAFLVPKIKSFSYWLAVTFGFLFVGLVWSSSFINYAQAYSHTVTCADESSHSGGGSCSADVITVTANNYWGMDILSGTGGSYYITANWSDGTGTMCGQASGPLVDFAGSGSYHEHAFTGHSGDTGFTFDNRDSFNSGCTSNTADSTFTISSVCIDDDGVSCGGGGGGGGGGTYHFGSGGIPPAYTANFTTTTQQAAALGAIGDIRGFLWGYLPQLIELMVALIVLGIGAAWIYSLGRGAGWTEADAAGADMIKSFRKDKFGV